MSDGLPLRQFLFHEFLLFNLDMIHFQASPTHVGHGRTDRTLQRGSIPVESDPGPAIETRQRAV